MLCQLHFLKQRLVISYALKVFSCLALTPANMEKKLVFLNFLNTRGSTKTVSHFIISMVIVSVPFTMPYENYISAYGDFFFGSFLCMLNHRLSLVVFVLQQLSNMGKINYNMYWVDVQYNGFYLYA